MNSSAMRLGRTSRSAARRRTKGALAAEKATCRECEQRNACAAPCPALQQELRRAAKCSDSREFLLPLWQIDQLWRGRGRLTLGDLILPAHERPAASAVLDRLTKAQRLAVELRYFDGLSERAIAARLGVSKTAVHKRLAGAKRRLRALTPVAAMPASR
jgi:DNA-directed RNA polymerase specialized sigma24 family protein